MQTKLSISNRLRQLPKRQTLRIGLGIAVMIALIFVLWPTVG